MSVLKKISLLLILSICVLSCKKEGPGGKAKVIGVVAHHGVVVPGATVYIKYGATDFPGNDISVYERSYTVDQNGNYAIGSLVKGNYYLYAVGYDTDAQGITEKLTGGVAITLTKKESKSQDIAVTE
ncbi:MAG: hypothetical protein ACJ76F_04755 [Bacteroidia bacterium]